MSQPRGGPMITGHASHQIGLDADIWFVPMPTRTLTAHERETIPAVSMLMTGRLSVDPAKWSDQYLALLKRAAS
jgi:penicillin-insensitive murein endopeptidase